MSSLQEGLAAIMPELKTVQSEGELPPSVRPPSLHVVSNDELIEPEAENGPRQRSEDRNPTGQKKSSMRMGESDGLTIALTAAQEQILADALLMERKAATRVQNVILVKECVNIILSVVTIVGGVLAITKGVRAAAEADKK